MSKANGVLRRKTTRRLDKDKLKPEKQESGKDTPKDPLKELLAQANKKQEEKKKEQKKAESLAKKKRKTLVG